MTSDCWVMCGGPTGKKIVDTKDDVIAVNKDVFRYEKARYFITMDNRFIIWEVENQRRTLPKKPTKIFIANMACPSLACGKSFVDTRWGISYNLSHYDMIIKSYKHDGGFGYRLNDFRSGGNSGFCAVQFALIMGYKNIHLVGVDLGVVDGETHHHGGYHNSRDKYDVVLAGFAEHFKIAVKHYKELFHHQTLINHSPVSPLREFLGYEPL